MPPLINDVVLACLILSGIVAGVEFLRFRSSGRLFLEVGLLLAAVVVLHATTGFPRPEIRRSFGGETFSLLMVSLLFLCILLGMAARYLFYLRDRFSWISFLKPLCVSPIVLLPLLGTLQNTAELEPIQVISFCLLAFQNGFFWRVVFERARPSPHA